jgi:hypothetical protein
MEPVYAYLELPLPPPTQEQKDKEKPERGVAVLDLGGKDEDSGSEWVSP